MTAKRDSKSKPKKDERPRIKKETLRDLKIETNAERIRGGGRAFCTNGGINSC